MALKEVARDHQKVSKKRHKTALCVAEDDRRLQSRWLKNAGWVVVSFEFCSLQAAVFICTCTSSMWQIEI
jgi:hypothetical protein